MFRWYQRRYSQWWFEVRPLCCNTYDQTWNFHVVWEHSPSLLGSTNIQKWHWCWYWCIKSRDHQWQFLAKRGCVIWLIRWQIQKRGVIWHEIAQNPGNFNTFLISLENFDRKSNNWGSLGVKSCKKGRHWVKKKKKMQKRGLLSGGWHIPANGSVPPPSSWPNEVHTYLLPLSQLVISCEFKCSIP